MPVDAPMTSAPAGGLHWRVGVDVGGTFADCVATAAGVPARRLKLMTDGRLRLRATGWSGDGLQARVDGLPDWARAALVGCTARALETAGGGPEALVVAAEPTQGAPTSTTLRLDRPLPAADALELASGLEAPGWGVRLLTGTPLAAPLPPVQVHVSTTRGTNALLEGAGAQVGLVTNLGLEGVLDVGTQQRLGLFDLVARAPRQHACITVGVDARLDASGAELCPPSEDDVARAAAHLRQAGVRHVAVAFMHAWRNPVHEQRVATLLEREGFESVTTSSAGSQMPRLVPRAQAAVVEAALRDSVRGFLDRVQRDLPGANVRVSTSAGGVRPAGTFRAVDSLLSGPAAGCAGAFAAMRRAGVQQAVTFDMGGTSTDVARLDRAGVAMRSESAVAGVTVAAASVDVHSVAAGGGSVCRATGSGVLVGPHSAGARPGPACYGGGGPLTLTDVNLLLGRLWPGLASLPLDEHAALRAAEAEAARAGRPLLDVLEALLEVAHEHMAAAVRRVSTSAGHDVRQHALMAFGGAGAQHACAVAARLGMREVLVPPHAGFISAQGALMAAVDASAEQPVLASLGDGALLAEALHQCARTAEASARRHGAVGKLVGRAIVELRAPGRSGTLAVDAPLGEPAAQLAEAVHREFEARMRALRDPAAGEVPEVEGVRVWMREAPVPWPQVHGHTPAPEPRPVAATRLGSARVPCPVHRRDSCVVGVPLQGPALVVDEGSTVVVEPGWTAVRLPCGSLRLTHEGQATAASSAAPLDVAAARFVAIADWMGACLQRSAASVNVKERLDFSCGIVGPDGDLVANAPHVPVHLGALGSCVRAVRERLDLGSDGLALTNDPRCGGSHLPDLTLVRPVCADDGTPLGFVAARAHHAEIGGTVPGSMPTDAASLAEEGVLIAPTLVGRGDRLDEALVRRLVLSGPWPSRQPEANVADVRAAAAALEAGAQALQSLAREHGPTHVREAMRQLLDRSAAQTRAVAVALVARGPMRHMGGLDDGTPIEAVIRATPEGELHISLSSPGLHPAPFNAPASVTRSAVLYVLRVLAAEASLVPLDDHAAPLNEGFLRGVRLSITPGLLDAFGPHTAALEPRALPAVFAGNTETSQAVVEALLLAVGAAAASQGTMNNLVVGGDGFSVYETLGGGAGAAHGRDGASAVHVHMSNTRLTDPETLELRHPLRVERMQVRAGSGGRGQWHGGDGMVRRLRALQAATVCFVGQHRATGPAGLAGGDAGKPGAQRIVRADGRVEPQPALFRAQLQPGDAVEVETPGGGGFGAPATPRSS
jgi:5-oxoprolinase (ATP-hydrolysing)